MKLYFFFLRLLSAPFMLAGFVWQFISGSFYAGMLMSTAWIAGLASKVTAQRKAEGTPAAPSTPKHNKHRERMN